MKSLLQKTLLTVNAFSRYIIIALVLKIFIALFFFSYNPEFCFSCFKWYGWGGDTEGYIGSIDNLIETGHYYFGEDNFAGRMPGFLPVYFPLRVIFSTDIARSLTILFQLIFSSAAIVYLCKTVQFVFPSSFLFNVLFLLLSTNTFLISFDMILYSESIAISTMIFSIYYLILFNKNNQHKYLFISGLFMTWCIFMKPYLGILLPLHALLASQFLKVSLKEAALRIILFSIPFVIVDSIWIARNYRISGEFIPLQRTISAGNDLNEMFTVWYKFNKIIGGDNIQWNEGSHASWFATDEYLHKIGFKRPDISIFPEFIFSEKLPKDSLIAAREYLWISRDSNETIQTRELYKEKWVRILNGYIFQLKENHPFYYYVGNKFQTLRRLIFHKYTYYFPYSFEEANILEKGVKLFVMAVNLMILFFGIIGFFALILKSMKDYQVWYFTLPVFWIIIFFGFIIMQPEYRFFLIAWIFINVGAAFTISTIADKYFKQL
jgi:hypothetical protein